MMSSAVNEPCLVGDGFVISDGTALHMWYIRGEGWKRPFADAVPERVYKIAYAFSVDDGIHWHRQNTGQLIANSLGEDECQALPTVIKHNGLFT